MSFSDSGASMQLAVAER